MNNKHYSPKVSIITVCLNARDHVEQAILSVLNQSYKNIEYVVIDGGSTDGTQEIIGRYKDRLGFFLSEPDKGVYDAQNKGIKLSSGELVCLLNSDDRFYDNRVIEEAVDFFSKNKADLLYGKMLCKNGNDDIYLKGYPHKLTKRFFFKDTLGHPATIFKRSCFKAAGYYDDTLKISSDYEWYLRALFIYRLNAVYFERIIAVFSTLGISSNQILLLSEFKQIRKKYFKRFELLAYYVTDLIFYGGIFSCIFKLFFGMKIYASLRNWQRKRGFKRLAISERGCK